MTDLTIIRDVNALAAAVTDLVADRDETRQQLQACREAAEDADGRWQALLEDKNKQLVALHSQSVVVVPEDWEQRVRQLGLSDPSAFIALLRSWMVPPAISRPVYPTTDPDPDPEPAAEVEVEVEQQPAAEVEQQPAAPPPVDPLQDTVADLPIVPAHEDHLPCPNTPRCQHDGGAHVFSPDSPMLRCGVGGCLCGVPVITDEGKPLALEVTTDA